MQQLLATNSEKLAVAQKAQADVLREERELDDAKRELETFDVIDNVWVAAPRFSIPLATVLRQWLIDVAASFADRPLLHPRHLAYKTPRL
jgi:hypothetical protein